MSVEKDRIVEEAHKEFVDAAQKTASDIFNDENIGHYFLNLLLSFVQIGNTLDKFKKNIFYGKPLPEHLQEQVNEWEGLYNINGRNPALNNKQVNRKIVHGIIGKATEVVEMIEILIPYWKEEFGELDLVHLFEEIGDDYWYEAEIWAAVWKHFGFTDVTEHQVRKVIIEKLKKRYARQEFDSGEAVNRDLDKERKTLEKSLGKAKKG